MEASLVEGIVWLGTLNYGNHYCCCLRITAVFLQVIAQSPSALQLRYLQTLNSIRYDWSLIFLINKSLYSVRRRILRLSSHSQSIFSQHSFKSLLPRCKILPVPFPNSVQCLSLSLECAFHPHSSVGSTWSIPPSKLRLIFRPTLNPDQLPCSSKSHVSWDSDWDRIRRPHMLHPLHHPPHNSTPLLTHPPLPLGDHVPVLLLVYPILRLL